MRNKVFCLLGLILAGVFLSGCTGLSTLPANDAVYFRQKVGTALARNDCIKELIVLTQNKQRIAIITLNAEPLNAENDCNKVMEALSRDPLVPMVDKVNVKVEYPTGRTRYISGVLYGMPGFVAPEPELQVGFSCVITRDALLKGESPQVVIRGGIFVSGPNKGEETTY